MRNILIATTNAGKFLEMTVEFADLPFKFLNLKNAGLDKIDLEENYKTTWENAVLKAKFFAKKSKLLTIAEDTSFSVDYLKGEPGIKAKRYAPTALERNQKIIEQLRGVPDSKRGAEFEAAGCVYDPLTDNFSVFFGRVRGKITGAIGTNQVAEGLGYDNIFYYPPLKKTFAELPLLEKNRVSHRGKLIGQIKYFLTKNF